VILLGFVLSLTTVVFGGYLIYLIIGKANQFSMVAGILTMAILVSTTVTTIKDYIPKAKTVYAVLQAESLCTQIISLVCFTGIVTISLNTTAIGSMFSFSLATFANLIAGGLFIALMVGGLTIGLINVNRDIVFQSVATLFAIYLGYLLSMSIFKASGAIVVAGMAILFTIIGDWLEKPPTHIFIDEMWESLYAICYAATYLLFGATVTIWMFTQQYLVMAAAIVIIFGLRAIICYFTLPKGEKNLYFLGGVRGILPIVLTLGLPSSLPYWWTIQSIVCGVVLFSLVIQLPVLWMNVRGEIA